MGNQQVRLECLKYWLAGLIDGEGCIALYWKRQGKYENIEPIVSISNTDQHLLDAAEQVINMLGVGTYRQKGKTADELKVKGFKRVYKFLPHICDLLISKRDEAKVVLQFIESRIQSGKVRGYSEEELGLFDKCKELKHSKNLRDYTPTLPILTGSMI